MNKKWNIKGIFKDSVIDSILEVRGIGSSQKEDFIHPLSPIKALESLELNLSEAASLIKKHINSNSNIFIHGDYDVDGICATAILYQTIHNDLGYDKCFPFIPDRFDDGYGLSKESVDKIYGKTKGGLIITVDCGITAISECEYAKKKGFDVIITDHHQKKDTLPKPNVLVWSDKVSGSAISLALSMELVDLKEDYLVLAAVATICDLCPIIKENRSIVFHGLKSLNQHKPVWINSLLRVSGIEGNKVGTYEIGWIIGPRLNASGRLESALNSFNLLCEKDESKAVELAGKLNTVNLERQKRTLQMVDHARKNNHGEKKIIVASDSSYHEGVIGLVAGKLVQEFYRPAVVISIGESFSKGSARSVEGVSIIDLLRRNERIFESLGGHTLAAGFTIKTVNLKKFVEKVYGEADTFIDENSLIPLIDIDLELPIEEVGINLFNQLKILEPYGYGNRDPMFASRKMSVVEARNVGANGTHLKLKLAAKELTGKTYDAIFFGAGGLYNEVVNSGLIDIAYSLKENTFNGYTGVSLHIKDLKPSAL